MTLGAVQRSLDCCLRRDDTKGNTQRSLGSCLRRKDTGGPPQPGSASPPPASAARGEAGRLPPKGLSYKVRPVEAVEIRLGERLLLARLRINKP